ncbi:uncharacterized protein LOC117606129 [Osmia lignaria lignaria]|uniref:uncharacterized protein LOC117606129 n=1 Tax=Osmia lignaria lignaria TaxID=1437193 RepID=UPI00147816A1|nr:uncharacterized protein LOC117606129 [Osmia lignaria]
MKEEKSIRTCHKRKAKKNNVQLSQLSYRSGHINKRRINKICHKLKHFHAAKLREPGPTQYIFYAIVNTDLRMDQATTAATIANGLVLLYSQLDSDQVRYQYIDSWTKEGRNIIVLKGYDHKHLKYLHSELKFIAIGSHAVQQRWGRNKAIIVLIVFGQKSELEEVFEGLSYLK